LGGTCHLQTVFNVLTGFRYSQWVDVIVDGDPLADGSVAIGHQHVFKFRLANKKDVYQFSIVRSALFPETIPVTSLVVRHSLPLNNAVLPTEAPLCCRPNMSRSLEPTVCVQAPLHYPNGPTVQLSLMVVKHLQKMGFFW